jgi:hypothetical protein
MDPVQVLQLAKANFLFFCKYILNMDIGPHHIEWAAMLTQERRLLIECARGHGKSWFISKAYVLWQLFRNLAPIDVLIVSFSEKQAIELLKMTSEEVMRNPNLSHLRPSSQQKWTETYLEFAGGHKVRGLGFGTSVRGLHPSHIIVDDPLKDEGGMNPEEQYKYFMGALSGTAVRQTQIVIIGTPLDSGDLLEQLESNPIYKFKAYPAETSDRSAPLFPTLFTLEELRRKEEEIGSLAYAREFLLQRIDPKTQVFKDQFRTINELKTFPDDVILTRTIIDPAISQKEKACDSAIVTVSQDTRNHRWERETTLLKSDNPSQILDEVLRIAERYRDFPDYSIVIESEVFQKVLAFDLRAKLIERDLNIRVIEVRHQGNQGKHERIVGCQAKWEGRGIHLLPESPLIEQFRYYRPNIKGARIDAIDAYAWMDHPEVSQPYFNAQPVVGEIPQEARPE